MPRHTKKRRSYGRRRARRASSSGGWTFNKLVRAGAGMIGAGILLERPINAISDGIAGKKPISTIAADAFSAAKNTPHGVIFAAMVPSITAEAAIGTKTLVKKGIAGVGRAIGG